MERKKKKHTPKSSDKSHTIKTPSVDRDSLGKKWLKPEIILIGVFILALSIRLLYLNQAISTPIFQGLAVDDEKYDSLALQILNGNFTHKDSLYLNPLYPFFLALIYLIFGYSHLSVAYIQGIIDSTSCILIYYIASMLFNKRVGIIATLTYAFYGIAIFYTGILLAPTVVIFFTLLFIASLLFAEERRRITLFLTSGVLFGLAVLARPNVILVLFFLPLWFFTVLKNKLGTYKSIKGFLLLLVGFLMVTSLITIRNYSIEKKLTTSALGGINFYIGNNPKATGRFMSPHGISNSPIDEIKTSIRNAERESGKKLTPSQASRYWLFKGLKFIKDNPFSAFSLYMKKFSLFWRKEEISLNINYSLSKSFVPILRLPLISFGIMAPFALLGIILFMRRKNTILLTLFIFSYMVSTILFFVSARYRLPLVPFLIICASYALHHFTEMVRAKKVKGLITFAIFVILLLVGINKNFEYFKTVAVSKTDYNNLGNVYSKEGRLDEAIVELIKALSIDPLFAEAHNNLGNVYLKKGLIEESIGEYKKALKINPDYAKAHNNLGSAYMRKERVDEAISEYKKALAIDPDYARAHNNLGLAYYKRSMLDEAISEYKKALAINPNYAETHTDLGVAYIDKGMIDEAITEYKKALAINPSLAEAHANLSLAYRRKGRVDEAIAEYKKALAINPEYEKTFAINHNLAKKHNNLGNAYMRKERVDEAISEYKKALAINPNLAETHNNLGNAYMRKERVDEAISEYKKALAINPNLAETHNNLSVLHYYKRNYKLAILHCDKFAKLGGKVDSKLLKLLKPYR